MTSIEQPPRTRLLGEASPYVAAARALAPRIAAAADQIEHDRRLPDDLVRTLVDAGLFRMLVPASLGGGEADLLSFARTMEIIGAADASTAWCLTQCATTASLAARVPPTLAHAIFRDPALVLASGYGSGTAQAGPDGYTLTGEWGFVSGGRHATWLCASSTIVGPDGQPRTDDDGVRRPRVLLIPAHAAAFRDTWQVSGLRGTGSDSYAVRELAVPLAHTASWWDAPREPGPLYVFIRSNIYAVGFASLALGVARAMLDAFRDLARAKTPRGAASPLQQQGVIQAQVGRAEATWRAARAYLHTTIADAWAVACAARRLDTEQLVALRLATTHTIHAAVEVVDPLFHAAGATAILADQPFERRFRDAHAVKQHIQGSQTHYETVGQYLLGAEFSAEWLV